jgi:hypothetical protein
MMLFIFVLGITVIAMALMSVGLFLTQRPLQRGCGKEVNGSCHCAPSKPTVRRNP